MRAAAYVTRMDQPLGGLHVRREPMFNVPMVVVATLAVLVFIHVMRVWVLTPEQDIDLLLWFSFIPARYDATVLAQGGAPGGLGAQIWTFFTYALIHRDWTHLGLNAVWLLARHPIERRAWSALFSGSAGALY